MAAEAPVNVQAVCVGRDAFDISWERPPAAQGEEDLVSYSFGVFVKEASEDKFTLVYQTKDDDEATHTFRCVDLKEATKYEAYVQSFGIFSEGDCSKHVFIQTAQGAPAEAPQHLCVLESAVNEVTVQWAPPPNDDDGDDGSTATVKGYRMFFDVEDTDEYTEVDLPASQCRYTAQGLQGGSVYRFQVLAFNEGGEGPESPLLRFKLDEGRTSPLKSSDNASDKPTIARRSGDVPATSQDTTGGNAMGISGRSVAQGKGMQLTKLVPQNIAKLTQAKMAEAPAPPKKGKKKIGAAYQAALKKGVRINLPPEDDDSKSCAGADSGGAEDEYYTNRRNHNVSVGGVKRRGLRVQRSRRGNRVSWLVVSREKTIRGKRNGVRQTQKDLFKQKEEAEKEMTPLQRTIEEEKIKKRVVLYTTSTRAVRDTYTKCQTLMQLLYNHRLKVYMKDISMDKAYIAELNERLPGSVVPQMFVAGESLGGYEDIHSMNERNELRAILEEFDVHETPMMDCSGCGGTGFVMCSWCNGTRKSAGIANAFTQGETNKGFLKCTVCNENGLERCREC
eukprot:m.1361774 g.1361774  ORF g.1361774 m.1361774 type:complete len:562 (-) comp24942_c1_seq30:2414-4099(-)